MRVLLALALLGGVGCGRTITAPPACDITALTPTEVSVVTPQADTVGTASVYYCGER